MIRRPPRSPLFPYTPLSRSDEDMGRVGTRLDRNAPLHLAFPDPEAELMRSEEHTSELQSQSNLVCRLLLEKKKRITFTAPTVPDRLNTPCTSTSPASYGEFP